MATGALDANGIWQYGEDDSEPTFSGMLNKLASSTSTTVTRLEELSGLTTAQYETHRRNLRVGLVPMSPSTVEKVGTSATATALGQVNFTSCTSISLNGVFTSAYKNYRLIFRGYATADTNGEIYFRLRSGGVDKAANYTYVGTEATGSGVTAKAGGSAQTFYWFGYTYGLFPFATCDIQYPQENTWTTFISQHMSRLSSGIYSQALTGWQTENYSADGFTLVTTGVPLTGSVSVYGYND